MYLKIILLDKNPDEDNYLEVGKWNSFPFKVELSKVNKFSSHDKYFMLP